MNRIAVRSLVGGLRGARNYNRYISTAVAARPLDGAEFLSRGSGDGFSGFYWMRMMSSAPQPVAPPVGTTSAEMEQKESGSSVADGGKKGSESNVVVSNYWGIQRPKITREDGSEWPWNCFMVRRRRRASRKYIIYCLICWFNII